MKLGAKEFARALKADFRKSLVPLHEPSLGFGDALSVLASISTKYVSSAGPSVNKFENVLARAAQMPHAVAVSSGTAALSLGLRVSGVEPGDEVLMPALTFIGTANAASHLGAIPHFVDSDPDTLGISVSHLSEHLARTTIHRNGYCINKETGNRVSALVAVHTFGHIGLMDDLKRLTDDYGIALVEDAAQALGSLRDGRHAGSWGNAAALSFNGNKIITTGGGGALLTRHSEVAQIARHLATTARLPHPWEFKHDAAGYNYRMPNLNASLGLSQLRKLDHLIEKKRRLLNFYDSFLDARSGAKMFREPEGMRSNYWLQALVFDSPDEEKLNDFLRELNESGIQARPMWNLLSDQKPYRSNPRSELTNAIRLRNSILNLPSSSSLVRSRKANL